jgi:hypothetical protein
MRLAGPARDPGGASRRRGRPQPGAAEPPLQGPRLGPGDLGPSLFQGQPDQDGAPGGVPATQRQRLLAELGRIGMGQPVGPAIIGREGVRAAVSESLQQLADGAGRQVEGAGEAGGRLAALGALPELLPHGDGDGLGHGDGLRAGITAPVTSPMLAESATSGKTYCRDQRGKTYCPVTFSLPSPGHWQAECHRSVGFAARIRT